MTRLFVSWMLLSMILTFGCLPTNQEAVAAENPAQPAWGDPLKAPVPDAKPPTVVRVPADAPAELTAFALRKGPTLRERRAMGLTVRNVRKTLAEMQKAGELEGKDSTTLAVEVLDRLLAENPAAFQSAIQVAGADWPAFFEQLIAFLEKLIPLIIKLISLFS